MVASWMLYEETDTRTEEYVPAETLIEFLYEMQRTVVVQEHCRPTTLLNTKNLIKLQPEAQ